MPWILTNTTRVELGWCADSNCFSQGLSPCHAYTYSATRFLPIFSYLEKNYRHIFKQETGWGFAPHIAFRTAAKQWLCDHWTVSRTIIQFAAFTYSATRFLLISSYLEKNLLTESNPHLLVWSHVFFPLNYRYISCKNLGKDLHLTWRWFFSMQGYRNGRVSSYS
jgi:hypothetical protein